MLNYTDKIKEIIDITKTSLFLVLEESYFSKLPPDLEDAKKQKLAIIAINDVFLEETPLSENDIRQSAPELVTRELKFIKDFLLRGYTSSLEDVIRLKAFCISKMVSPNNAKAYLVAARENFPLLRDIPNDVEVKVLLDAWDNLKQTVLIEDKEDYSQDESLIVQGFEAIIREHEEQLFGVYLFNKGIEYLYKHNKEIIETSKFHYNNIMERGEKAITEAKELIEKVKSGKEDIKLLKEFRFPPIHGLGLDEMRERASLLVQVYEKIFPGRPREKPLTKEENEELMEELGRIL